MKITMRKLKLFYVSNLNFMNKEIYRLAIPNILSNITIPLLSSVDIFLVSRHSLVSMGAVGLGATIFNFIYWNFGFLRMGTTGLTAQSFGAGDEQKVVGHLLRSLLIGFLISLILLMFGPWIKSAALSFMRMDVEQLPLVEQYFDIRLLAAPATLGLYSTIGWLFGRQNALYPLIITIFANLLNIGVGYFFVEYFSLGIEGVAWATVLAQYFGFLLSLFFVKKSLSGFDFNFQNFFKVDEFKKLFKINRDLFFRTLILTCTTTYFTMTCSGFGIEYLAISIAFLQIVSWVSFVIDGYAYALESLVGKSVGENDQSKFFFSY